MRNGERHGGFIVIEDSGTGIRYAVRPHQVGVVIDADEARDATVICVGSQRVRVESRLEEVVSWFALDRATSQNRAIAFGENRPKDK